MVYVFTFLGEFGYELLNWQGVIRKLSKQLNQEDKIVICTRNGLSLLYEFADEYIDISDLYYYKNSVATGYRSNNPQIPLIKDFDKYHDKRFLSGLYSYRNYHYVSMIKKEIMGYIQDTIGGLFDCNEKVRYIFSDRCEIIKGLQFGRKHRDPHDIYAKLDIANNEYIKLSPDETKRDFIEKTLDFNLDCEYILCQAGNREIVQRSKEHIDSDKLLYKISRELPVVLLDFNTGRNLDSGSEFNSTVRHMKYKCRSFEEQSVLISHAKTCLFFTEGDFRSHNYLPPFMGKDVFSVANKTVFELPTTPLDYWNKYVFRFGGQIIPVVSEKLSDRDFLSEIVEKICK